PHPRTRTYPLSLHDALPISQETPEKFARFCERAMAHLGDLIPLACTLNEVNIGPLLTAIRVEGAARSEPWFEAAARAVGSDSSRDRKSTRLNSSHVSISYAV